MSDTENETQMRHFTEIRMFETANTWVNYAVCLDCGACVFVDEADRKEDIHPIAIHLKFHEDLDKKLGETLEAFTEKSAEVLKNIVEGNKTEFTKEVMDSGRQVHRTKDVQDRREMGTNRPQGPRPGPVPGVPREGRGEGQGDAGGQPRVRPTQGPTVGPSGGSGQAKASS